MNVGTGFVRRPSGRNRMINDIPRLMDDVGRLRGVGFRRLFDHEAVALQK